MKHVRNDGEIHMYKYIFFPFQRRRSVQDELMMRDVLSEGDLISVSLNMKIKWEGERGMWECP